MTGPLSSGLQSVLYLIMGENCRQRTSQHDAALQTYRMQTSAPQSSLNRYVLYSYTRQHLAVISCKHGQRATTNKQLLYVLKYNLENIIENQHWRVALGIRLNSASADAVRSKSNSYITADVLLHPGEDFVLETHVCCPHASLVYQMYSRSLMSTKLENVGLGDNDQQNTSKCRTFLFLWIEIG